jgi:hypothetical protein
MAVRKEIVQATDADVVVKVGTGHYIGASLMAAAANSTLIVYDSVSVAAVANSKIIDVIACTANTSRTLPSSNLLNLLTDWCTSFPAQQLAALYFTNHSRKEIENGFSL